MLLLFCGTSFSKIIGSLVCGNLKIGCTKRFISISVVVGIVVSFSFFFD